MFNLMSKNLEYIWCIYMYIVNTIALNNQQYLILFCKDVSYAHVSRSLVLIQKIIHTKNSEKWINSALINKKVPTIHTGILPYVMTLVKTEKLQVTEPLCMEYLSILVILQNVNKISIAC